IMQKVKRVVDCLMAVTPARLISVILSLIAQKKPVNRNEWALLDRIEFYLWSNIRKWPLFKIKKLGKHVGLYTLARLDTFSDAEKVVKTQGGKFTNYLP
ncbi:hypothetical protein ACEV7Y_23605, partial [Vibrio parahaemolyticus]